MCTYSNENQHFIKGYHLPSWLLERAYQILQNNELLLLLTDCSQWNHLLYLLKLLYYQKRVLLKSFWTKVYFFFFIFGILR